MSKVMDKKSIIRFILLAEDAGIIGLDIKKEMIDFLEFLNTEPEDEWSEHYLDNFMCAFCNHFQIDASDFDMTAFLKDWLQQEDK